jgi:hypothetical protein
VLEHPAYSKAWKAHGIAKPPTGGQWVKADDCGGWTCYVEQGNYGHPAKKATWLYACRVELPELKWGHVPDDKVTAYVSWCGNRTLKHGETRKRVGKKQASATPPEFREALLAMARSVK